MRLALVALAPFAVLLAGCARLPAANPPAAKVPSPDIVQLAVSYREKLKLTAGPVAVDPALAMLCRGANQWDIDRARGTKGPHANAIVVIYMNEAASRAFANRAGPYAEGAVIVKEKRGGGYFDGAGKMLRSSNDGVGGMIKRPPGFDPAHGDWEYFYFEEAKKIETGAIASCVKCHEGAKATDYVFGTWVRRPKF